MADQCKYLEYRQLAEADDGNPRAYCIAADQFVQAMRADICNERYGLDPETDCEFHREAEGLGEAPPTEGARTKQAEGARTESTQAEGGD